MVRDGASRPYGRLVTTRTKAISAALVPLALAAGTVVCAAQPASAAPAVKIYYVYYNSPGSDTRSNTSLNAEYVVLKNMTGTNRSLTGWTLKDKTGYTYKFPTFTLKAGAKVTVHTGKGTATQYHRYFGFTNYVWNNTGDTAYLRTSGGTLVHSCSWTGSGSAKYC